MINAVPDTINKAARMVVLNHPRSMEARVWRKRVTRVETNPSTGLSSEMGGAPTLGGMGVLRSEDEPDFEYELKGYAVVLLCGVWEGQSVNDRGNAAVQPPQEAQVEAVAQPGTPEHFTAEVGDLVFVPLGLGAIFAFSIEDAMTSTYIGSMIRRYVLQPRDDLHDLTPFED